MRWMVERCNLASLCIILLVMLALAVVCLQEVRADRAAPDGAASALEPLFSPPGGVYPDGVRLVIAPPSPGDRVFFTVDGSEPTPDGAMLYTQPIQLSADEPNVAVIRARLVRPDGQMGPVISASYFLGLQASLPVMSLIVEPDDLWGPQRGIYANPVGRGMDWERPVDVTFVDVDRRSGFHVSAGIRVHGEFSRGFPKKSLRVCFRRQYGPARLEYPVFPDSDVSSFQCLVLHNGGQDLPTLPDMRWTLLRNQLLDDLAHRIGVNASYDRPVLVFLNGEPWGIYQLRERLNEDFLADHFGIEEADFLKTPEWAERQAVLMGDRESWDRLLEFVETHDLADPADYAYVQSQVDVGDLIDYTILQIYGANTDWPDHNMHLFRPRVQGGRWQWVLWDNDRVFGMVPESNFDANMMVLLLEQDSPDTGGRDVLLLRGLLGNPAFAERFLSRAADLLNTAFAPEAVLPLVEGAVGRLAPDVAFEALRWPNPTDWESNVQTLRDFALRRPEFVRQHMVESFHLGGVARLAFAAPGDGSGTVAVNGAPLGDLPWEGVYFQGVPVEVTAVPSPGYRFAGWDPPHLAQTPVITLVPGTDQTISPRFVPVRGDAPRPGDVAFGRCSLADDPGVGDWFELRVLRPGGVDLRGWRVTDNDTKTATDEGSLVFPDIPAFARVPGGTTITIVAPPAGAVPPRDDLNTWDRRMVLHVPNGSLDLATDPGFNARADDNLVLLAPGPTEAFDDDPGIAFFTDGLAVTPASFGVLADGVWPAEE